MLVLIQISPGDIKVAVAEETPIHDLRNLRGTWRQGLTNEASGRREWCGDAPSCNKNTQLWKCHLTCAVVTVPSAVKRPIAELDTVCLKNWICDDRCLSTQQIISLQEKNKPYSSDLEVRSYRNVLRYMHRGAHEIVWGWLASSVQN